VERTELIPPSWPPQLRELIDTCIDSVEQLDIVLTLHRDSSRWWSISELASVLEIPKQDALRAISDLCARGVAAQVGGGVLYRLAVRPPFGHTMLAALERCCATDRSAVVDYVRRRAMARLQLLAQAFTRTGSS
jgi:hypothetical protein